MRYRFLGRTGLKVSEIGFGTWGLGGDAYGLVDDNVSRKTLKLAFDLGVNFYDTSDLYGNGHSEKIISEALKPVRDEIIIATKFGTLPHKNWYMPQDFSEEHILKSIHGSLERLQTDYVDLYQLHSPPVNLLRNDGIVLGVLKDLKQDGVIREFGVSVRSPNDGYLVIQDYPVVQVNFNLIDQRVLDNNLLKVCNSNNVGVIVRTPFCFGFLTGGVNADTEFGGEDHRVKWSYQQKKTWADAVGLFNHFVDVKGCSLSQFALKFCLSYNAVSTVIPGMMNMDEVKENVASCNIPVFSRGELSEIYRIYSDNDFMIEKMRGEENA